MDLFAIAGVLWRHKRVAIPVVLLTVIGLFYVVAILAPAYQAAADVLLVSPPASPTAAEIAQDPSLAKVNNPYANLGNPTYVADVVATLVTSVASQQSLEATGVSPGYQVAVDTSVTSSQQSESPPALDITSVGSSAQAAIQSANLVAAAISSDLRQLQEEQHVQSTFMITAVEYVTPSSAVKSSSGKLKTALGVAVVGFIVLLVAVSAAQGLEERKNGRPRRRRQPDSRGGGYRDPAGVPADAQYGEPQRAAARIDDSRFAGPARRPGMQRVGSNEPWDQSV